MSDVYRRQELLNSRLPEWTPTALLWLVFGALLLHTTRISTSQNRTLLVIGVYGAVYSYYLLERDFSLDIPTVAGGCFAVIVSLFGIQILLGKYTSPTMALYPFYTSAIAGANLFFVPKVIRKATFVTHLAAVGAVCGVFGLIGFLVAPDRWLGIFSAADNNISIFVESNILGVLAVGGVLASLSLVHNRRSDAQVGMVLLGFNLLFVALTLARGALVAVAFGSVVYLVDTYLGRREARRIIFGTAIAASVFVTAVILAPVEWVRVLPLTGRQFLWKATVAGVIDTSVLLGAGFVNHTRFLIPYNVVEMHVGPHNSYLFVLLRAGLVAMLAYAALVWVPIVRSARSTHTDRFLLALVSALAIQLFVVQYTPWSAGIHGGVLGLALGYLWQDTAVGR